MYIIHITFINNRYIIAVYFNMSGLTNLEILCHLTNNFAEAIFYYFRKNV